MWNIVKETQIRWWEMGVKIDQRLQAHPVEAFLRPRLHLALPGGKKYAGVSMRYRRRLLVRAFVALEPSEKINRVGFQNRCPCCDTETSSSLLWTIIIVLPLLIFFFIVCYPLILHVHSNNIISKKIRRKIPTKCSRYKFLSPNV